MRYYPIVKRLDLDQFIEESDLLYLSTIVVTRKIEPLGLERTELYMSLKEFIDGSSFSNLSVISRQKRKYPARVDRCYYILLCFSYESAKGHAV
jgi:hypothetical protein